MHTLEHFILLFPVVVASFWMVIILFSNFKSGWRKITLSFFMLSGIVPMLLEFLFYTGSYVPFRYLYVFGVFMSLSQFPAFYNYIVSLTSEKPNSRLFYLKHWIIPVSLTAVVWFLQFYLLSGEEKKFFIEEILTGNTEVYGKYKIVYYADNVVKGMFILLAISYFHLANLRVNDYEENILNYFSNTDKISFTWFKLFKISFFFAFISGIVYQIFDRAFHSENIWISLIVFLFVAFFYGVVGFFGTKQVDIYLSKYDSKAKKNELLYISDEVVELDANKVNEIARSIDALIKNRKLYLKQDLTLVDLSLITRISRSNLLYVINNHLELNFKSYINQKRINYAKHILSLNEIVSKDNLYKDCGFKSQTKFCEVFRDFTGESPMKFRNKVLLSDKAS